MFSDNLIAPDHGFRYNRGRSMGESSSLGSPRVSRSKAGVLDFSWVSGASVAERRSLLAGGLGWMLDAMDLMLYALVLTVLISSFGMSKSSAGLLQSLTLVSSAFGGFLFGIIADRIGRARALMLS